MTEEKKFEEEMKEFEKGLEVIITDLYADVELEFKKHKIEYSRLDVYDKTCEILTEIFTKIDEDYDWDFTPTFTSMKDLYEKSHVK